MLKYYCYYRYTWNTFKIGRCFIYRELQFLATSYLLFSQLTWISNDFNCLSVFFQKSLFLLHFKLGMLFTHDTIPLYQIKYCNSTNTSKVLITRLSDPHFQILTFIIFLFLKKSSHKSLKRKMILLKIE